MPAFKYRGGSIEAVQWTGNGSIPAMRQLAGDHNLRLVEKRVPLDDNQVGVITEAWVRTIAGDRHLQFASWLIRFADGTLLAVAAATFDHLFEPLVPSHEVPAGMREPKKKRRVWPFG